MQRARTVGIIVIGNELLGDNGVESNSKKIIAFFHSRGYRVEEVRIIRDAIPTIANAVGNFADAYEYVCTSGGIGPTHDDMTLQAVAHAFHTDMQHHQPMTDYLAQHFLRIEQRVRDRLSLLPQGTQIYANNGYWPVIQVRNCFTLPGVPIGMERSLARMDSIIPRHASVIATDFFVNCSENVLLFLLEELALRFPAVEIGCYPATTKCAWKTKLHIETHIQEQFEQLSQELHAHLEKNNWLVSLQTDE